MKRVWEHLLEWVLSVAAVLLGFWIGLYMYDSRLNGTADVGTEISDGKCNIAVLNIKGEISSWDQDEDGNDNFTSDEAVTFIKKAEDDPQISGLMVVLDTYGGYPAAGEVITNAVKRSRLPSVALIREAGTSAGYLIASGADRIIASVFSDVGAIGLTSSYVENWEKDKKEGLNFVSLTSAPFKDYGNPDKPLTPAERTIIERDLKTSHEELVKQIAENRKLPIVDVEKLADGSSMTGPLALQNKLIDEIGDEETAHTWFGQTLSKPVEEIAFCY